MAFIEVESTIKLVIGVFRHGIRTPHPFDFPNNPYWDYDKYFPEGPMQLTEAGKVLMHDVGKHFRLRYNKILGDKYSSKNVKFYSTCNERSMMSTEVMAQAIFPPQTNQPFNPIPVWVDYDIIDKINEISKWVSDTRYNKLQKEALRKLETDLDLPNLIYKPLSNIIGRSIENPIENFLLFDCLFYQEKNGLNLPKWAEEFYPDILSRVNKSFMNSIIADTPEMLLLSSGTLFHFIKGYLTAKANNTLNPDRQVVLFGGHDTSLLGLLHGIGNKEPLETSPGAMLVFELHEINNQHIVKAFYFDILNNEDRFHEISISICDKPCTLDAFNSSLESIDKEEWKKRNSPSYKPSV